MQSDLSFLPSNLLANDEFKRAWGFAVSSVRRAAKSDSDRSTKAFKKQVRESATKAFSASRLIRDEIDSGLFAGLVEIQSFANKYGFASDDIQTVRSFLHLLMQDTLVELHVELGSMSSVRPKSAVKDAAYLVGCLCRQFDLGKPTDYANASYEKNSVAISLLRCLLIDGKEDGSPSISKLRNQMKVAKQGYENFRPKT